MKTLEEFWYGNIEPSEYDVFPGKEYKEALACHPQRRKTASNNDGRTKGTVCPLYGKSARI